MNQAHFHLVTNHLPIIVPIIGLLVLIGGFIFRSEIVKRTAFFIFVFGAICTVPAFFSGEGAEEIVEHIEGMSHHTIHEHEEVAELFAILSYLLGFTALVALWANWKQKSFANILSFVVLIFSVVVLFFAQKTGASGGEIRHPEITTESTGTQTQDDD